MSRISYVGELGWEIYAPFEQGRALWDTLWEAGQPFGLRPAGIGVYGTTGRIEKGYRLYGAELESEYNVVEAGMARPSVKDADFVGKEAYLRHREEEPAATLCTLTVDDNTSSSGVKRYMLGREPILTLDGERIVDAKGRPSYVTSAGSGPSVGKHILLAYLPPAQAREGEKLLVQYMGERYPVTVDVAGSRSLFDPENERIAELMDVLVCVKRVPETGARITLTADEQEIDTSYLGFTISPHEECAVEEALRLVEAHGGSTTVLTLGPAAAAEQLRNALAMGVGAGILLETDGDEFDPAATAAAIVDVVRDRGFDLLLFGNEAADSGDYQVRGARRGRARPAVRDRGSRGSRSTTAACVARREAARRLGGLRGAAARR